MGWIIGIGLVLYVLYQNQQTASTPCSCSPGYPCNCPATPVSGVLSALQNLFSPAPASEVLPPEIGTVQGSGVSAVDSTVQPWNLFEAPLPPAGGGVPQTTVVSTQPPNSSSGSGFGTAQSVGGQIARVLYNPRLVPGSYGGGAYGRSPLSLGPVTTRAAASENSPTPPTAGNGAPANSGNFSGAAPVVTAGGNGNGPNAPVGGSLTGPGAWVGFGGGGGGAVPHTIVTETPPWIQNGAVYAQTKPLPGSSVHPGIPLANEPVNRAGGSTAATNVSMPHASARVPASAARPAVVRLATSVHSPNVGKTSLPATTRFSGPAVKPVTVARPVISKALPAYRTSIGVKTVAR